MKGRTVVALIVVIGCIGSVAGLNLAAGSDSALAGGGLVRRERALTFQGTAYAARPARVFSFSVPGGASVRAQLTWRHARTRLAEDLLRAGKRVRASAASHSARIQTLLYRSMRSDRYAVRVRSLRGASRFTVVVRMTWTALMAPSPTPTGSPAPTIGPAPTTSPDPSGSPAPSEGPEPTEEPESSTTPAATFGTPSMWSAEFMADGSFATRFDPGLEVALRQARTFDVIAAHFATYDNYVSRMKAANSKLRLLVYVNGTFSPGKSSTQYPDSWYARDAGGNKIRALGFGTFLMDPLNAGWIGQVVDLCRTRLSASGYDGCFLDVLGTSGINPGSVTAVPVDPATGAPWTRQAWLEATEAIAVRVRNALGSRPVFGNGLGCGASYFASPGPTSRILDGLTGAMAEVFVRPATSPVDQYKSESAWKADVDMLAAESARGSEAVVTTKVWVTATQQQIDSWHRYALATFLLGYTPGKAYFSFRSDHDLSSPYTSWQAHLGDPAGPYAKSGGLYRRLFANGLVLVNPTSSAASVSLLGSYASLTAGTVSGSITLAPHTAQILTKA